MSFTVDVAQSASIIACDTFCLADSPAVQCITQSSGLLVISSCNESRIVATKPDSSRLTFSYLLAGAGSAAGQPFMAASGGTQDNLGQHMPQYSGAADLQSQGILIKCLLKHTGNLPCQYVRLHVLCGQLGKAKLALCFTGSARMGYFTNPQQQGNQSSVACYGMNACMCVCTP